MFFPYWLVEIISMYKVLVLGWMHGRLFFSIYILLMVCFYWYFKFSHSQTCLFFFPLVISPRVTVGKVQRKSGPSFLRALVWRLFLRTLEAIWVFLRQWCGWAVVWGSCVMGAHSESCCCGLSGKSTNRSREAYPWEHFGVLTEDLIVFREKESRSRSLANLGDIAEVAYREGRRGRPCSHDQFMARLGLCLFIACHRPSWALRPEAEEFFLLSLFCCCFWW